MAALGEAGLLDQPHTSAGRVPTAGAFRYYVEQITQANRIAAIQTGTLPRNAGVMTALPRRASRASSAIITAGSTATCSQ